MSAHAVALAARVRLPAPATRPCSVALCGFGTVGRSVARILSSGRHPELQLTHIFNRDVERRRADWVPRDVRWLDDIDDVFGSRADVLVEVVGGAEPARSWIARALESGRAVVTANEQVIAEFGPELLASARLSGRPLRFEAAVGGGIPIIQAIESGLAGDEIVSIGGVLDGTSNYVLTRIEASGLPFDEALSEARALGYAEADPSEDIDGLDARARLAILSMVALRLRIPPRRIAARGIRGIAPVDFAHARRLGGTIRQVASLQPAVHDSRVITARVGPAIVPLGSPLARAEANGNVVVVRGLFGGETSYAGSGAGGDPAAVAIVSDLLAIARGATSRFPIAFEVPRQVHDVVVTPHYVRLPDGGVPRSWRLLLDGFARHELEATILEPPGRDRRDPALLVDMCSSALMDGALAAYARCGGPPAVSMPVLFPDGARPAPHA